ncbi:MAG: sugar transferase [Culicoidibacterales bacterium]
MQRSNKMQLFLKRLLDIVVSSIALIVLSPVLAIVAVLVRMKLGSPILFTQNRPGKGQKVFKMYKFRTMLDATDKNGLPLPDEQRLTKFGKLLRSTSLDELPELWNVLKGEMSLVGPRPLLEEYLPLYSDEQLKRHDVRPGVTGLAQVKGRNSIDWTTKFAYDIEYVENISVSNDIKILWLTVVTVLKREGISSTEHATMEKFNGHN